MGSSEIVVYCAQCEKHVTGREHGVFTFGDESESFRRTFLACPNCAAPFVVQQEGSYYPSDFGSGYETTWSDAVILLPSDPKVMDSSVPLSIATSYLEARRIYTSASAYTAAAIMCRRTLEGVCAHFAAQGGNLAKKLDDLKTRGVIEARIHEWANHVLRSLGNDAAHDVDATISREDAKDALDFTKAIIEYLFVFEAAFQGFKKRRNPALPPAQPPP